jgi:hypothetical protein
VYKTTDAGATWNTADTGLTFKTGVNSLAIAPNAPQMIYAGTYGGVFRSDDGGANWSTAYEGLNFASISALAVHPVISNTLYAGSYGQGAFMSTDAGANWHTVNNGLGNLYVNALAVNPGATDEVYAGTLASMYLGGLNSASVEVTPGSPASLNLSFGEGSGAEVSVGANSLPAGSLPTTLTLIQTDSPTAAPGNFQFGGISFSLNAFQNGTPQEGFTFNPDDPPQITITYTDGDVDGLNEDDLALYFYNEDTDAWETGGITIISRNPAANTITVAIDHLTDFAMFAPVADENYRVFLPIVLRP